MSFWDRTITELKHSCGEFLRKSIRGDFYVCKTCQIDVPLDQINTKKWGLKQNGSKKQVQHSTSGRESSVETRSVEDDDSSGST